MVMILALERQNQEDLQGALGIQQANPVLKDRVDRLLLRNDSRG